jgi:hypothetical protein
MVEMRKQYGAFCKAKVAIEAIKGEKSFKDEKVEIDNRAC